jgi:hypothetical protein
LDVLGESQRDVLGALCVGKQVAVCSSLLKSIGVKSGDVSCVLSVTVVAVDDAGEVFVLVVAGASELVEEVADRDQRHGHEESALFAPSVYGLFYPPVTRTPSFSSSGYLMLPADGASWWAWRFVCWRVTARAVCAAVAALLLKACMMCGVYKPNRYADQSFSWSGRVMSNRPWRGFVGPSAKGGAISNHKHFVYKMNIQHLVDIQGYIIHCTFSKAQVRSLRTSSRYLHRKQVMIRKPGVTNITDKTSEVNPLPDTRALVICSLSRELIMKCRRYL